LTGAVLVALILTAAVLVVGCFVTVARFHRTPEYHWRMRVFEHSALLATRRRGLVADRPQSPEHVVDLERHRALEQAARAIPLSRVMEAPRIGEFVLSSLRSAGIRDVPTMLRTHLQTIEGIGPQKAEALYTVGQRLVRECEQAFLTGRSSEGASFAARAAGIRAHAEHAVKQYERELAALDAAGGAHLDAERLAAQVTLFNFLRGHRILGLDAVRMHHPFPTPQPYGGPPGLVSSAADDPFPATVKYVPAPNGVGRANSPGNVTDDPLEESLKRRSSAPNVEPLSRHPQQDRLEAFARFGVMVALADGRPAQAEFKAVRNFLAEMFGHESDLLRRIDPLIELATVSRPETDHTIDEAKRFAAGAEELRRLHQWACQIADVSSGRNERETALLQRIAAEWNLAESPPQQAAPAAPAPQPQAAPVVATPPPFDSRAELDIPADAEITVELVRRRYTFLVDRLDAVRLDGLGEEFIKLAAIKREKIEAAALALLTPLGATLTPPAEPPPPPNDLRHNPDLDAVFGA
jgi:hypothetical protein